MRAKIISILLTFFIFVIISRAGAGNVNSMKNMSNRDTAIKVSGNRAVFQKSKGPAKQPVRSFQKLNARFQLAIPYSVTDYRAIMGTALLCVNFLKALEETKKPRLTDSLHKVICSYEFFQDPWKGPLSSSGGVNETDSPNSNLSQPFLKLDLNPNESNHFDEGQVRSTLKLLQMKREEIFNEIFMGFRFSFGSKNKPMLVEMNISPFPEKGPGLIIAF
jgi:hypothetical protein